MRHPAPILPAVVQHLAVNELVVIGQQPGFKLTQQSHRNYETSDNITTASQDRISI
jgi:hypothetical protein